MVWGSGTDEGATVRAGAGAHEQAPSSCACCSEATSHYLSKPQFSHASNGGGRLVRAAAGQGRRGAGSAGPHLLR